MDTPMYSISKKRKENWRDVEVCVLVNAYAGLHTTIDGRFSQTLTQKHKHDAWEQVAESINCQSPVGRTIDEIKKKLSDLKTSVKKKERERRRRQRETGGGPAPAPLKDWEEQLLTCLPQVTVSGFGGVDNFKDQQALPTAPPAVRPRTLPTRTLSYEEVMNHEVQEVVISPRPTITYEEEATQLSQVFPVSLLRQSVPTVATIQEGIKLTNPGGSRHPIKQNKRKHDNEEEIMTMEQKKVKLLEDILSVQKKTLEEVQKLTSFIKSVSVIPAESDNNN